MSEKVNAWIWSQLKCDYCGKATPINLEGKMVSYRPLNARLLVCNKCADELIEQDNYDYCIIGAWSQDEEHS